MKTKLQGLLCRYVSQRYLLKGMQFSENEGTLEGMSFPFSEFDLMFIIPIGFFIITESLFTE